MYQYPNYSQQMNNYQPYNPMMNAQQRLAQMEQQYPQFNQQGQFQQQVGTQMSLPQQFAGLNGKIVDDFGMITANDVPMDGNGAIFIKKDGSEIQMRNWTANGTIQTTSYKPILDVKNSNTDILPSETEKLKITLSDEATEVFMKRFDDIEKRLDDFGLSLTKSSTKSTTSRTKKEADSE